MAAIMHEPMCQTKNLQNQLRLILDAIFFLSELFFFKNSFVHVKTKFRWIY